MPKKGVKIDPYANGAEKSYFSKQVFPSSSKQNICSAKNVQQKSWILPNFYDSSSAGNPGCHWIMGLKIKSYYQICAFWCQ